MKHTIKPTVLRTVASEELQKEVDEEISTANSSDKPRMDIAEIIKKNKEAKAKKNED